MAETYCGKTCAECGQKETMNCPGCRVGPGRLLGGDCDLAKCCRAKGHDTCQTCSFRSNCGSYMGRDSQPDYRRRRLAVVEEKKAAAARRAPFFGKWLWILFWLVVPAEIAGLLNMVSEAVPALQTLSQVLSAVCNIAYCVILLKLGKEEAMYRKAGICGLAAYGVNLIILPINSGETVAWVLLLAIPAVIVSFVGDYHEYKGHASVLWGIDNELSDKWDKLWKWYIGTFAAVLGGLLVMLISVILGALIIIAACIALIVVSIIKWVYLYRTAKAFR